MQVGCKGVFVTRTRFRDDKLRILGQPIVSLQVMKRKETYCGTDFGLWANMVFKLMFLNVVKTEHKQHISI